jgi:hypothetical protein
MIAARSGFTTTEYFCRFRPAEFFNEIGAQRKLGLGLGCFRFCPQNGRLLMVPYLICSGHKSSIYLAGHSAPEIEQYVATQSSRPPFLNSSSLGVSDGAQAGPVEGRISGARLAKLPGDRPSWQRR